MALGMADRDGARLGHDYQILCRYLRLLAYLGRCVCYLIPIISGIE